MGEGLGGIALCGRKWERLLYAEEDEGLLYAGEGIGRVAV